MITRLLIEDRGFDARAALLQDGQSGQGETVVEVQIELADVPSLVGSIRRGRVRRIVPGLKAAFVEVGLDRPGMLHVRETAMDGRGAIADALHVGEQVLVQVIRDPVGDKGVRLTMRPTLPGRRLALLPGQDRVAIAQRIRDREEREHLRSATLRARESLGTPHGCIVRSAAEGASEADIEGELRHLLSLWADVEKGRGRTKVGDVLHRDLPLPLRAVRDLAPNEAATVEAGERSTFAAVQRYMQQHAPELAPHLQLHGGPKPLFESAGVERAIRTALEPRVALPCGGFLVIETTEALTAVDVNSGNFVASGDGEARRVNHEAAQALARELRLRNIGGIVVVDFIEMSARHEREVLAALRSGLAHDPAQTRVSDVSPLGIVEIGRRRRGPSLSEQLEERCPTCRGKGRRLAASLRKR